MMHLNGDDCLKGKVVAIQGIGSVGYALAEMLHEAGAKLIVADTNQATIEKAVKELGAVACELADIYDAECDVFAPTAIGAILNDDTIPRLKCKVVCGGANNVLKVASVHGPALQDRGILYAPDFVANAGGVINVAHEVILEKGYDEPTSFRAIDMIYDRLLEIFAKSKETGKLTYQIADEMAEARIEAIVRSSRIRTEASMKF
jgi:leucine dehydrogenase